MTIAKIWEQDFSVLSFHLDPMGKAHLSAICNFLQEGASQHAEQAGFGFDDMLKRNQVWVLTRMKVMIDKYPVWKDELKLKTWSRGNEGIFYIRDFIIEDANNNPIIKATSSWAAINIRTRRPEIVDDLEKGLFTIKDKKAIDEKLDKLPNLKNTHLLRKRRIEYTDIDMVYHVNNVKYIELIINSFSKQTHLSEKIIALEINYLGEAKYDDDVLIFSEQQKNKGQMINIIREEDNKEVCRTRIDWQ